METADLAFLRLEHLQRRYGATTAVRDLSLAVPKGALLALLGPSGCGKSTTLRMIAGLEPPDAGRILVGDNDITHEPPYARRMGVVFQSYALFPHLSVLANVAFGLRMRRIPSAERSRRAAAALDLVGLAAHAAKRPRQLSGGQQQRVAVARALAIEPDVLLLDEPLSALDAKLREELRIELRALQRRVGATAVFVTHDQAEALAMADQVAVMHDGALAQLGTPEEVFERPATPFVAEFVGRSARLHGTAEPGGLRAGPILVRTSRALVGPAQAFIRPHRIRLLTDSEPSDNILPGTVAALDYTGETVQIVVDTEAGRLPVDLSTAAPTWRTLNPGAPVRLGWSAADTIVFPA